jgi:hypothetical protein
MMTPCFVCQQEEFQWVQGRLQTDAPVVEVIHQERCFVLSWIAYCNGQSCDCVVVSFVVGMKRYEAKDSKKDTVDTLSQSHNCTFDSFGTVLSILYTVSRRFVICFALCCWMDACIPAHFQFENMPSTKTSEQEKKKRHRLHEFGTWNYCRWNNRTHHEHASMFLSIPPKPERSLIIYLRDGVAGRVHNVRNSISIRVHPSFT